MGLQITRISHVNLNYFISYILGAGITLTALSSYFMSWNFRF